MKMVVITPELAHLTPTGIDDQGRIVALIPETDPEDVEALLIVARQQADKLLGTLRELRAHGRLSPFAVASMTHLDLALKQIKAGLRMGVNGAKDT